MRARKGVALIRGRGSAPRYSTLSIAPPILDESCLDNHQVTMVWLKVSIYWSPVPEV